MQQEEGQTPNLVKSKVRSKAAHFQLCLDDASVMGDDTCPPAPGGASSKSIGILIPDPIAAVPGQTPCFSAPVASSRVS